MLIMQTHSEDTMAELQVSLCSVWFPHPDLFGDGALSKVLFGGKAYPELQF